MLTWMQGLFFADEATFSMTVKLTTYTFLCGGAQSPHQALSMNGTLPCFCHFTSKNYRQNDESVGMYTWIS